MFVRKRLIEIQYFRTVISDEHREEFGHLVQDSIRRIELAQFLPHIGIHFPQNPCTSCPYIGLCLGREDLAEAALVRPDPAWERRSEAERDTHFVELGRYLCEVRAGQYWRVENLKSFDEFLTTRFPESRRKAYYLMSIHEHLPPQARRELKEVGWAKGLELAKVARRDGQEFDCATWLAQCRSISSSGRWSWN